MPKKTSRNYETIIILDSVAEEDKIESVIQKYAAFLTKSGSEILNIDRWGRKKFAYPIKKRNTGYYASIEFTSGAGIVGKLERAYQLDEDVLRYLTISFNKKTLNERKLYFEKKAVELAKQEERASAEQSAETKEREAETETPKEENKV